MKPAAVLIAAFEIHVGAAAEARIGLDHGRMAHAGVEPDVQDIFFLGELRAAAAGALESRGRKLGRRADKPGVRPFALEDRGDVFADLPAHRRALTVVAIEDRNRHTPGTLARDAPVGPALQHAADALASP